MTEEQQKLVRDSWAALQHRETEVAAGCFAELLRTHPHLTSLFDGILDDLRPRLAATLSQAVGLLGEPAGMAPELARLGHRHRAIGVKAQHHKAMSAALQFSLGQLLGPAFTPAVRSAWGAFYGTLEKGMAQNPPSGTL